MDPEMSSSSTALKADDNGLAQSGLHNREAVVSCSTTVKPGKDDRSQGVSACGEDYVDFGVGQIELAAEAINSSEFQRDSIVLEKCPTLTLCGLGKHRPLWLQRYASKECMLFWMCWFCIVQGMLVNGLVPSVLTTIERRFDFGDKTLGLITQFYDIGYVLCCIPVSYFGGRHSKPLYLGIGMLIMGIGSFLFSMPHMVTGKHQYKELQAQNIGRCASVQSITSALNGSALPTSPSFNCSNIYPSEAEGLMYGPIRYEIFFCIAHFLHGVGATPLFTLGVSYIDENVKSSLSAMYIGIFYTFAIFGPAIGFLMSAGFLRFHTDYFSQQNPTENVYEIEEDDASWVGAWWLGFLVSSLLAFFAVLPILSFPTVLPGAFRQYRSRLQQSEKAKSVRKKKHGGSGGSKKQKISSDCFSNNGVSIEDGSTASMVKPSRSMSSTVPATGASAPSAKLIEPRTKSSIELIEILPTESGKNMGIIKQFFTDLRAIPVSVKKLFCNPCYMFINLAGAIDGILITGFSTFMAKYLERQFSLSSSKANMIIGCIMVPVAGAGTLASGYIVKRFRLTVAKTIRFCISVCLFSLILSPMFLVYCDSVPLVGINSDYPLKFNGSELVDQKTPLSGVFSEPNAFNMTSDCNAHCSCFENGFHPVCGKVGNTKYTFFSPCYAGCSEQFHHNRKLYSNCICSERSVVGSGWCESTCANLTVFLVLFAPMVLFTFSLGVPAISIIMRCVDYEERSFALGIQWILIRCIGTIPAPQLFGWLFDIACMKRHQDPCRQYAGKCYAYDSQMLSNLFLVLGIICQTITLMFLVLAALTYKGGDEEGVAKEEVTDE